MQQTSVLMPSLAISLTDTFARYTGVTRHNINPYMGVMNVMDGLIYEASRNSSLVVRDKGNIVSKSLKDIIGETLASPLFQAGLQDESRRVRFSGEQENILKRISAFVSDNKLSEKPLEPGEAYFLSVMVLNRLHDLQPTVQRDSSVATYDVETYAPKTGQSGVMFAL